MPPREGWLRKILDLSIPVSASVWVRHGQQQISVSELHSLHADGALHEPGKVVVSTKGILDRIPRLQREIHDQPRAHPATRRKIKQDRCCHLLNYRPSTVSGPQATLNK